MGNAQPRFGGYRYAGQSTHSWQENACFWEVSREGGRVLPGGVSLPYRSIGLFEKFSEIFGEFGIAWHACGHGAAGGIFCDRQTRNSPKALRQTALPAGHQYRLQIAERRGKILGELSIAGSILTTIAQMTDTETVMNLLRVWLAPPICSRIFAAQRTHAVPLASVLHWIWGKVAKAPAASFESKQARQRATSHFALCESACRRRA